MSDTRTSSSSTLERLKEQARIYADRHATADGLALTPVPGLHMMRAYEASGPMRSMYRPLVCLVLQGAKQLAAGRVARTFAAGQAVVVAVDLPVIGRIVEASRKQPYIAVAIDLDIAILQSVAARVPDTRPAPDDPAALTVQPLNDDVLSCAARLMRLIEEPAAVSIVRPAVLQELHYWLLSSAYGPSLRALTLPQGNTPRIGVAVEIIRKNFQRALAVEDLAAAARMSPSTFHRHFKAVTSVSPLQFQKQLRLMEARRLMERSTHRSPGGISRRLRECVAVHARVLANVRCATSRRHHQH